MSETDRFYSCADLREVIEKNDKFVNGTCFITTGSLQTGSVKSRNNKPLANANLDSEWNKKLMETPSETSSFKSQAKCVQRHDLENQRILS